jgi:enamine deaminase RidA (YjgF/YER057c/UK114 family)
MTERRAIPSGSTFEEQIGYARAVVDGDWVHVSGTTGVEPCWPVLRRHFGAVRPAATMLMCGLADPRMKIEIEVYAAVHRVTPRSCHEITRQSPPATRSPA